MVREFHIIIMSQFNYVNQTTFHRSIELLCFFV